jgi:hypothetical protein
MATMAGMVSTQGEEDTILVEAAMAAAVLGTVLVEAATVMLEAPLLRGDVLFRDLVVEGLGMDLAEASMAMVRLVLEVVATSSREKPVLRRTIMRSV